MLADRVLVLEKLMGEGLATDHLTGSPQPLVLIEGVAAKNGNTHGSEIPRIGPPNHRILHLARLQRRVLSDRKTRVPRIALPRKFPDEPGRSNTRQRTNALYKVAKEICALQRLAVFLFGKTELHGQHILRD